MKSGILYPSFNAAFQNTIFGFQLLCNYSTDWPKAVLCHPKWHLIWHPHIMNAMNLIENYAFYVRISA